MKKLSAMLAILLTLTLTMETAEARRFGGGKTFGRTYQTAPSQPSSAGYAAPRQQAAGQPASPAAAQPARTPGKGMMGGLLGGLLVGGLFAALFAGGAFHGLQLMDILLIALLAWVALMVIRRLRQGAAAPVVRAPQPAYAHASAAASTAARQAEPPVFGSRREAPAVAPVTSPLAAVTGSPAVPFNLPLGFDTPAFLAGATEHYRILQDAWNKNDLPKIQEYVTPGLYADLQAERAALPAAQHTEVLAVNAELVRADQQFGEAEVSIRFQGRYRDVVEGVEEDFTDIWHLLRDYGKDDAPWHITGIESV